MDARLTHDMLAQRAAAAHAVAGALAPKSTSSTARSFASAATTGTSSTTATDPSSTITSSDFLTLLVNELKNQDPTQPTDPNAYITQLAQVNSLEQLISINSGIQQLDSSIPATTTTPTQGSSGTSSPGASSPATAVSPSSFTPTLTASAASHLHKLSQGVAAQ